MRWRPSEAEAIRFVHVTQVALLIAGEHGSKMVYFCSLFVGRQNKGFCKKTQWARTFKRLDMTTFRLDSITLSFPIVVIAKTPLLS